MKFRDRLTLPSRCRFGAWWLTGGLAPITLTLRTGVRFRCRGLKTTDYGVAVDVFHNHAYRSPRPLDASPRHIVDLGANVGFSLLHWLHAAPGVQVVAYEPHPAHVAALRRNLALNDWTSRVDVRQAAVGTRPATATLSDRGSSSSLTPGAPGIEVPVVDLYADVNGPVDILKVDIEGAEYELLDDPRLAELAPRVIVVEWHGETGYDRLAGRLAPLGYEVEKAMEGPYHTGILWAYRR
jgi:FkbM family methyltransferase